MTGGEAAKGIEISFLENQESEKNRKKCFSYCAISIFVDVLTGSHYVSQASLHLVILLLQLLERPTSVPEHNLNAFLIRYSL